MYSVTIKKDVSMTRNITLSADEKVIKEARMRAQEEHSSLNVVFRDWLYRYAAGHRKKSDYSAGMERLSYVNSGRKFSREEMNAR